MSKIKFNEKLIKEDDLMNDFMGRFSETDIEISPDNDFILVLQSVANVENVKYNYHPSTCPKLINFIFDKVYVINLEHENVMKKCFWANNNKHNLKYSFIKGVYGKEDKECIRILEEIKQKEKYEFQDAKLKNLTGHMRRLGQVGCLMSFLKIFKDAKKCNYKRIIIFEDDVVLHKDFCSKFIDVYLKVPCDWNIIRLGTSTIQLVNKKIYQSGYFNSQPCVGAFAICYKNTCFDMIVNEAEKFYSPFDRFPLNCVRNKDYTLSPNLAIADLFRSTTDDMTRSLFDFKKKLNWDLDDFNFVCSIRKVNVYIAFLEKIDFMIIDNILQQTYFNIELCILTKYENFEKEKYTIKLISDLDEKNVDEKIKEEIKKLPTNEYSIIWPNKILPLDYIEIYMNNLIKTCK
jgi:GR25 family glycosyltransferase involved in LPS biosynthesis